MWDSKFFSLVRRCWKKFAFCSIRYCCCCCDDGRQRGSELCRRFAARRFVVCLTYTILVLGLGWTKGKVFENINVLSVWLRTLNIAHALFLYRWAFTKQRSDGIVTGWINVIRGWLNACYVTERGWFIHLFISYGRWLLWVGKDLGRSDYGLFRVTAFAGVSVERH